MSTLYAIMYHISLLSENTIIQTLQTHPLYWQFHNSILLGLSVVVPGIEILSQAKIWDLYHIVKINPEKEQFRSAYAVPLIQVTKFCSWLSFFKLCGNTFFLWIEDSTLVALNCAMHTCLKNRYMVFMEASVAFVVASFTPAAPSSVKAFLC